MPHGATLMDRFLMTQRVLSLINCGQKLAIMATLLAPAVTPVMQLGPELHGGWAESESVK